MQLEACCHGPAANSIRLFSAPQSAAAAWTEHLRGSACLLQRHAGTSRSPAVGGPAAASAAARLAAVSSASADPARQLPAGSAGVTARLALRVCQGGAETGYRMHPAATDAALHAGAVNPAAPRDGRVRIPAALDALHIHASDQVCFDELHLGLGSHYQISDGQIWSYVRYRRPNAGWQRCYLLVAIFCREHSTTTTPLSRELIHRLFLCHKEKNIAFQVSLAWAGCGAGALASDGTAANTYRLGGGISGGIVLEGLQAKPVGTRSFRTAAAAAESARAGLSAYSFVRQKYCSALHQRRCYVAAVCSQRCHHPGALLDQIVCSLEFSLACGVSNVYRSY